jgi:hypothetical protein
MPITIVEGVDFDTIAREWRCKWSADGDKKSLAEAQAALSALLPEIEAVTGQKSIQRVVCGGCLDFKVITALPAEKFGDWEKSGFAPEGKFLAKLKTIPGITTVETQTYTLMPAEPVEPIKITDGVEFDTIAREWRCKWSADNDKKSLAEAQKALKDVLAEVKTVKGVKDVKRIVCGGCLDFKVVVALDACDFGDWEKAGFAPEAKLLDRLKAIKGISSVETQTYTLMPAKSGKAASFDMKSLLAGAALGFLIGSLLKLGKK